MQILKTPKRARINAIAFSPSGRDLAAVCGGGQLRIWDTIAGNLRQSGNREEMYCIDLVYLSDDCILLGGQGPLLWHLSTNTWESVALGTGSAPKLALSSGKDWLAFPHRQHLMGSSRGFVLCETKNWTNRRLGMEDGETSNGIAFSPDGNRLATSHVIQVGTKQRSFGLQFGPYPVNTYDYIVHVRNVITDESHISIPGWGQHVNGLAFSSDDNSLAGIAGPRLRIWDLAKNRELALHKRGPKHFQDLSFTTDGRYLATVSNDETVRLWDTRTWEEKTTFTWQIGRLLNIAFAPDGLRAAAGSDKGRIVIWDVEG